MRYPFDATGTIGKRPCEISLNRILAEKNDPRLTKSIMKLLLGCRTHLKALQDITDNSSYRYFKRLLKLATEARVSQITGVEVRGVPVHDVVASHTMCCLHAYLGQKEGYKNDICESPD